MFDLIKELKQEIKILKSQLETERAKTKDYEETLRFTTCKDMYIDTFSCKVAVLKNIRKKAARALAKHIKGN